MTDDFERLWIEGVSILPVERQLPGQEPYLETMFVQCTKALSNDYPVGTKFKIRAKIIQPVGKRPARNGVFFIL